MTDKEFRRLSRADLITIIFELQKNEQQLNEELERMQKELEETQKELEIRRIKVTNAGSIAEASLQLNCVFEAAQKAADEYLERVRSTHTLQEEIIEEAEKRAAEIEAKANSEAQLKLDAADRIIRERWAKFNENVNEILSAHSELKDLLNKG